MGKAHKAKHAHNMYKAALSIASEIHGTCSTEADISKLLTLVLDILGQALPWILKSLAEAILHCLKK